MNKDIFRTVLVLSPHTDDGELGAGGTIARLVEGGSDVSYFAFSAPQKILRKECEEALQVLGVDKLTIFDFKARYFHHARQEILEILYDYNQKHEPHLILTPSTNDLHQDHQTITNEALRAFKSSSIFGYELPWNLIVSRESAFVSLEERHVVAKLNSCWKYQSQIKQKRAYFDKDYLRSLLRSKGLKIQTQYAEAFEAIKLVLKEF
ncbi:MAG: PIG-L deacetylase family protein [Promethearchaeota archaeon]